MDFEDILTEVGAFGKYQKRLLAYFMIPTTFASALYVLNAIFMVAVPPHWCRVPQLVNSNLTLYEQKLLSLPVIRHQNQLQFSQCKMYDLDYDEVLRNLTRASLERLASSRGQGDLFFETERPTVKCLHGWTYDQSLYTSNAVTEWDLVCDSDQLPSLVLTLGNVGSVVGTLVFGAVADRLGRRQAFFLNLAVIFISGTLSVFSPNFVFFAVCRMLTGATLPANFQLPYIIVVEQVGPKQRSRLVCLSWVLWTLGGCTLALIAYATAHWVVLGLVTTLPSLLFFSYWRYLPESPRFLLSQGRYTEAESAIAKIASVNGKTIPQDLLPKLMKIGQYLQTTEKTSKSHSLVDLWRYPQLRKKLFIVTLNWCAIAVAYFGLIMNVSNLGGNDFLNYFYLSVVELPAFFVACFLMDRWGRRWTNTTFVLIAGISCFVPVFVPSGGGSLVAIIASLIGKFGSAAAFMVIYQQAAELYPTPVRSLGMSIGATLSSLAIIFMPYVVYLGVFNPIIPFLILGGLCLLASVVSPLVPETLHENLPQSIEESEKFGAKQTFFSCARKRTIISNDCNSETYRNGSVDSTNILSEQQTNNLSKNNISEFLTSV